MLTSVLVLGWLFSQVPEHYRRLRQAPRLVDDAPARIDAKAPDQRQRRLLDRLDRHYRRAVVLLHARAYAEAVSELTTVLDIAPRLAEGWVNIGYALLGLKRYQEARNAFLRAVDLRPDQTNAYYGLGETEWELGHHLAALGAMETFIHRSSEESEFVRKARSAVWEWRDWLRRRKTDGMPGGTVSDGKEPVPVARPGEVSAG